MGQYCYYCKNNCTSKRDKCLEKDSCKGWYLYLITSSSTYFAKGIRVGIKFIDPESGKVFRYKHGDFGTYVYNKEKTVDGDWPLPSLKLEWQPMERAYTPTLRDKLRKFFLHKNYPEMVDVRPENNTIVITRYRSDSHYEIIEYDKRCWVSELDFPVKPTGWAYIPKNIMDIVNKIIAEQNMED